MCWFPSQFECKLDLILLTVYIYKLYSAGWKGQIFVSALQFCEIVLTGNADASEVN